MRVTTRCHAGRNEWKGGSLVSSLMVLKLITDISWLMKVHWTAYFYPEYMLPLPEAVVKATAGAGAGASNTHKVCLWKPGGCPCGGSPRWYHSITQHYIVGQLSCSISHSLTHSLYPFSLYTYHIYIHYYIYESVSTYIIPKSTRGVAGLWRSCYTNIYLARSQSSSSPSIPDVGGRYDFSPRFRLSSLGISIAE